MIPKKHIFLSVLPAILCNGVLPAGPDFSHVPGTVVDHLPVTKKMYMPTSTIVIIPKGDYVVAHDHGSFDHSQAPGIVKVFGSSDKGKTWKQLSTTKGRHHSLFLHRGALYLIGPVHQYGDAIVRKSSDGGKTWTEPKDKNTAGRCPVP